MKPPYHLQFYKDKKKAWRWRVVALNGNTLGDSGQGYSRLSHCRTMAGKLFPRWISK